MDDFTGIDRLRHLSLILEFPWNSSTSFDTINSIKVDRASFFCPRLLGAGQKVNIRFACVCVLYIYEITPTHSQIQRRHLSLFIVS